MTRSAPALEVRGRTLAEGRSNAAITAGLVLAKKAVGKHIANVFDRLDSPPAPDDTRAGRAGLAPRR